MYLLFLVIKNNKIIIIIIIIKINIDYVYNFIISNYINLKRQLLKN